MAVPIQVRLFCLDRESLPVDALDLTNADLAAAGQIRDGLRRQRFLAARRAVRILLAEQMGGVPEQVPLQASARPGEKPGLARDDVHFSVSRRGCHCAVAISRDLPVGVDVEVIPEYQRFLPIVEQILPAPARQAVLAAPHDARPYEFALWWCRIESSVKACGGSVDDATASLATTRRRTMLLGRGLAVAVATPAKTPFHVRWVVRQVAVTGERHGGVQHEAGPRD